jgi:hypothetical protein
MRSWQDLRFWLVRHRGLFIIGFELLTLTFDLIIENINIGYIFWLVSTKALTFHMSVSYDKTFLWMPTNMTFLPLCLTHLSKTFTMAIIFEWYILGLLYFTWVFLVTKPYHGYKRFDLVTLTLVFNLLIDNFNLGYIFWLVVLGLWYFMSVFLVDLSVGTNNLISWSWPWCLTYILKTLTLPISFKWYVLEFWYLIWISVVTNPFSGCQQVWPSHLDLWLTHWKL